MNQLSYFTHVVGHHCSSSSVADVLRYDGLFISEPMAFGVGSGLGFHYIFDPEFAPQHRFNGRATRLEQKFYQNIGFNISWVGEWQPEKMREAIAHNRPVLAITDIYHLPYYAPPVHFLAHGLVVLGVDDTQAVVADTFAPEPLTITLEQLQAALNTHFPPIMYPYQWAKAPQLTENPVTAGVVRRAIALAAGEMLDPATEVEGLPAMCKMVERLPTWGESQDWAWAARYGYQGIEKRGTGGGGFRTLYGWFLQEAETICPDLKELAAPGRFLTIGQKWQELAEIFKEVFKHNNPAGFNQASQLLHTIWQLETAVLTELYQWAKEDKSSLRNET